MYKSIENHICRKRPSFRNLVLLCGIMILSVGCDGLPGLETKSVDLSYSSEDKVVLAFYYPWYGKSSAELDQFGDHPLVGHYRSSDTHLIDYHLNLAYEAGIQAFFSSWGGPGHQTDVIFKQMLEAVEESPFPDFKMGILYENLAANPAISFEQIRAELEYILEEYGEIPAYFRYSDRPVVFIYSYTLWPVNEWQQALEGLGNKRASIILIGLSDGWDELEPDYLSIFDSLSAYADIYYPKEFLQEVYLKLGDHVKPAGKPLIATVIGGGSRIQKLGFDIDRSAGRYLTERFRLAQEVGADWVIITSWNEWYEGRQIEPSVEYQFEAIRFTRQLAAGFRAVSLIPLKPAAVKVNYESLTGDKAVVEVINTGGENLYAISTLFPVIGELPFAYLLRPGEIKEVSVVNRELPSMVTVTAYLVDNTVVSDSSVLDSK